LAERFRTEGYRGNLIVDQIGSDAAIERFCNGELDIVNADRTLTAQETTNCSGQGRTPVSFRIATDAMVVAVSPQNTFLSTLTTAELTTLFSTALNWSDVRADYPAQPIKRYIPADGTDEFAYLATALFGGNGQALLTALGVQTSADFSSLLIGIQSDPLAVALLPANFANRNASSIKLVAVNGIPPNADSVINGAYPLVRPIILYSDSAVLGSQTHIADFINYVLTNVSAEIAPAGFYAAGEANLQAARSTWLQVVNSSSTTTSPTATPTASEALAGVYCAAGSANIRINGVDAPSPQAGCVCVKAYGDPQLETEPDLYLGLDESQIETILQSPDQCLDGVTIHEWRNGTYDAGFFTPHGSTPNAPTVSTPPPPAAAPDETSLQLLLDVRSDLELFAGQVFGAARPSGWSGITDATNPDFALLTRLDLEILAIAILGDVRPLGWFGSVGSSPYAIIRDIRHDLELLADAEIGVSVRPDGWKGAAPLLRCSRAVQTLVDLLQRGGVFASAVPNSDPDYCAKVELEATTFSELTLLSVPADQAIFSSNTQVALGAITIDTDFAIAFLDRGAALSVGRIPTGEPVTPVGRSVTQFSRMMLVQGADFLVFVDYRDTTVDEDQFEELPDAANFPDAPFCRADWCGE
jgi:phosphate transport system substrate-binding protein